MLRRARRGRNRLRKWGRRDWRENADDKKAGFHWAEAREARVAAVARVPPETGSANTRAFWGPA